MEKVQIEIITILLLTILIVAGGYYFKPFIPNLPSEKANTKEETEKPLPTEQLTFQKIVEKLDSSQKIVDYLNKYYKFEPRESNEAYSPKQFFKKKKGGVQDYAVFAARVLDTHGYETLLVPYKYGEDSFGAIIVFRTKKETDYLSFSEGKAKIHEAGTSFEQTLKSEEERLGTKIKSYKILTPGPDLTREEWVSR